jgi:hypothetical protein
MAFRKIAVEQWKSCDHIVVLSQALGVQRQLRYKWRDQLEPIEDGEGHLQTPASVNCGNKSGN